MALASLHVIVLWGLDGHSLLKERLYKRLYDSVREIGNEEIDYPMDVTG